MSTENTGSISNFESQKQILTEKINKTIIPVTSQKNGMEINTSSLESDKEKRTLLFLPSATESAVNVAYLPVSIWFSYLDKT